jgi:hypothetical protein
MPGIDNHLRQAQSSATAFFLGGEILSVVTTHAPRRAVHTSITRFRGIGRHYHVLLEESGKDGRSYACKFDTHIAAVAWIHRMAKQHFPVRSHRLLHSQREGSWFYRAADDC